MTSFALDELGADVMNLVIEPIRKQIGSESRDFLKDLSGRQNIIHISAADFGGPIKPEAIVIHSTAGGDAVGSSKWLSAKDDVKVSAHFVVCRTGEIIQLVPTNIKAFHAGVSEYNGRKWLNNWSVGIELANWGYLKKKCTSDNTDSFVSWTGDTVDPADVETITDAATISKFGYVYWEKFTFCQIRSCAHICAALCRFYTMPIDMIVGHYHVAPGRKVDPGPAFSFEQLRSYTNTYLSGKGVT